MKRLSGWDAMMLYSETPNMHMHTVKIAVIDASAHQGEIGFDQFKNLVRKRLPLLEPLRYQLVDIPFQMHHPMWQENVPIDLDFHVRRARVRDPGGRRELDELIGELASTPLDRSKPMWEFHFVEGMADDRYAVICKVHHALADGVASANLLAMAANSPIPDDPETYVPDPSPSSGELLRAAGRDHMHQVARLPRLIKHTVDGVRRVRRRAGEREQEPALSSSGIRPTFMNHVLSPTRTFATATLALADVKETKSALDMTINDLVLAITTGAMRALLLRYDGHCDEPIVTSVPAATDTSPGRISGNRLSGLFVTLPVNVEDTSERVRLTRVASAAAKENYELLGPELPGRWTAYLPPPLAAYGFGRMAKSDALKGLFNVSVSNVPGPRERANVSGAPMSEFYSVGPLTNGSGINITVWSYVDQLNISVLSDDTTVGDPHEVTEAMIDAFAEIRAAAGLSEELTVLDAVMAQATAG